MTRQKPPNYPGSLLTPPHGQPQPISSPCMKHLSPSAMSNPLDLNTQPLHDASTHKTSELESKPSACEIPNSPAQSPLPCILLAYAELRRLACSFLRGERGQKSLQPTALVHEAYLRLASPKYMTQPWWSQTDAFVAICARVMKQVLIDHARKRQALKRRDPLSIDPDSQEPCQLVRPVSDGSATSSHELDMLEIDTALRELESFCPRAAEVVHLRFFLGLSNRQAAESLGISLSTAEADWRKARAWLLARSKGLPPFLRINQRGTFSDVPSP